MVGVNLIAVGAVVEPKSGDTSANAVSPSEGTEFAGVLEAMLPADALPASEESASSEALQAQMATLGLPLLTLLPVQTPAVADRAVEPSLHPAPSIDAPIPHAPTTTQDDAPAPAPVSGDGMGEADFPETHLATSESLLAVEGDAPPVPARQAAPPSPLTSVAQSAGGANTDASAQSASMSPNPIANATLVQESTLPNGQSSTQFGESSVPNSEPPAPLQEMRPPHGHAAAPAMSNAGPAAEDATPSPPAEPNWGVAEQIAQHIERMVYERERNRLTVRLDPPELGIVELRIQAMGSEVQAWLTAERDLTRQMLQQAQQYLREQLEARGLHLTHFDVGAQSQFQHAPREQYTRYAAQTVSTRTPTATDSLLYDGRWSVWV